MNVWDQPAHFPPDRTIEKINEHALVECYVTKIKKYEVVVVSSTIRKKLGIGLESKTKAKKGLRNLKP